MIVFSPVLAGGNADVIVMITTGFCGVLITMLALLELMSFQRWEEVLELICGAWMVASPFAFGYGGALRTWHFALGGIVVALAMLEIWQDRNRSAES